MTSSIFPSNTSQLAFNVDKAMHLGVILRMRFLHQLTSLWDELQVRLCLFAHSMLRTCSKRALILKLITSLSKKPIFEVVSHFRTMMSYRRLECKNNYEPTLLALANASKGITNWQRCILTRLLVGSFQNESISYCMYVMAFIQVEKTCDVGSCTENIGSKWSHW